MQNESVLIIEFLLCVCERKEEWKLYYTRSLPLVFFVLNLGRVTPKKDSQRMCTASDTNVLSAKVVQIVDSETLSDQMSINFPYFIYADKSMQNVRIIHSKASGEPSTTSSCFCPLIRQRPPQCHPTLWLTRGMIITRLIVAVFRWSG